MITECIIFGGIAYAYLNADRIHIRHQWRKIIYSRNEFANRLGKTLKILHIDRTEYGHIIRVELPFGYTINQLEQNLSVFKEGLGYKSIHIKSNNNMVDMHCIQKFNLKEYMSIKLPPNKLLIADGLIEPIVVDMNKFPHMLIGGDTGTGKSRILFLILTNIIKYCSNVELYLLQIRKNDLGVFRNCIQVKASSRTLDEVLESLEKINIECLRREELIDNTRGYYNIEDYNKNVYCKLKYVYVIIEEFSFLNISKGDTKEDKKLKSQCLKYIKNIVNAGRSSGVFLITSLQKPTSDSIPSDIKSQLCTRVSLKIEDKTTSIVVLGDTKASTLQEREIICKTSADQRGYSYTINHNVIMENIKHRIVKKKMEAAPIPKKDTSNIDTILNVLNEINR